MAEWIALVSFNDKGDGAGFWQADLFHGDYAETPETFFTLPSEGTRAQAVEQAHAKWPKAEVRIEEACIECGGAGEYEEDDGPEPCSMCDGSGLYVTIWSGK